MERKAEKLKLVKNARAEIMQQSVLHKELDEKSQHHVWKLFKRQNYLQTALKKKKPKPPSPKKFWRE